MKCRLIILLLLSLLFASPLCAETLPVPREYTAKLNLQAFEEGIEVLLKENNIPGGIVVIADSNGVIFEKGFGLRDLETGDMMDPASTVFRMASVAKAYTSTGILQLLEEGKLSLDTPINEYLTNLSIDYDTNTPITLGHLLTHTEGFENNFTGILTDDDNDFIPLSAYLKKNRPIPIITPGEFVTYGNDGTNVAGLIIEEVTGLSFEAYMNKAIFNPLKMTRSGFNKIPVDLMPFFAQEYVLENDATNVRQSLVYPLFAPGGGLYSTAGDQARFLQAMLNHSILSPPSRKQMFTGQFYNDERLPGMTFGFIENKQFSVPTYYRDGDGIGFKSRIAFIPDYDLGIMIYSNNDNDHFRDQVVQLFMKQLNSIPDNEYVPLETELTSYTGYYRINTYARKDFTKLQTLFSGLLQVSVDEDGERLVISPFGQGDAIGGFVVDSHWVPIEEGLFVALDGLTRIAFEEKDGQNYLYSGSQYLGTFEKIGVIEYPSLQLTLIIGTVGISGLFLLFFALFGAVKIVQSIRNKERIMNGESFLYLLLLVINTLNVLFLVIGSRLMFLGDSSQFQGFPAYGMGIHPGLFVIFRIPYLLILLVTITLGAYGMLWMKNRTNRFLLFLPGVLIVNQVVMLVWIFYWHLYI